MVASWDPLSRSVSINSAYSDGHSELYWHSWLGNLLDTPAICLSKRSVTYVNFQATVELKRSFLVFTAGTWTPWYWKPVRFGGSFIYVRSSMAMRLEAIQAGVFEELPETREHPSTATATNRVIWERKAYPSTGTSVLCDDGVSTALPGPGNSNRYGLRPCSVHPQ